MTKSSSKCLVKEGDILAIPLFVSSKDSLTRFKKEDIQKPKGKFAFARVIEDRQGSGIIIEIFKFQGPLESPWLEVISNKRLFRPVTTTDLAIAKKRWLVIGNQSNYNKEKDSEYSSIEFAVSVHSNPVLWRGGTKTQISTTEAKKFEEWVYHEPDAIEKRIISELKKQ